MGNCQARSAPYRPPVPTHNALMVATTRNPLIQRARAAPPKVVRGMLACRWWQHISHDLAAAAVRKVDDGRGTSPGSSWVDVAAADDGTSSTHSDVWTDVAVDERGKKDYVMA